MVAVAVCCGKYIRSALSFALQLGKSNNPNIKTVLMTCNQQANGSVHTALGRG